MSCFQHKLGDIRVVRAVEKAHPLGMTSAESVAAQAQSLQQMIAQMLALAEHHFKRQMEVL